MRQQACYPHRQQGQVTSEAAWLRARPPCLGQPFRGDQPVRHPAGSHNVAAKQHQVSRRLHGVHGAHSAPQPLLCLGDGCVVQRAGLCVQRVLGAGHVRVGE